MSNNAPAPTGARLGARLWRSFVTAACGFGMLVWRALDTRLPTVHLSTCYYGRCPTASLVSHVQAHPTLANAVLLGLAAALLAWTVPLIVDDTNKEEI